MYYVIGKSNNTKLTWTRIIEILKKIYPSSNITMRESSYIGTHLTCENGSQKIEIELNKYPIFRPRLKYESIPKNSFIVVMDIVEPKLIKLLKLKYIPDE